MSKLDIDMVRRFNETGMVGNQKLTAEGFKTVAEPSAEIKAAAQELVNFTSKQESLINLKHRWLDERQYEDFAEYKKIITKIFNDGGYQVESITKGFAITVKKGDLKLEVKIGASRITVSAITQK